MSDELEKTCTRCKTTLPLSSYSKQKDGRFGKSSICKHCCNVYKYNWKQKNIDKVRATNVAYRQRTREKRNTYNRNWRRINKERFKKRYTSRVNNRKRKQQCLECRQTVFLDGRNCVDHALMSRIRGIFKRINKPFNSEIGLTLVKQLKLKIPKNLICPKSGYKIKSAKDLHLEHNYALAKYPTLALDINNLHFTHRLYNYHKRDLSYLEYLQHCCQILQNAGYTIVPHQTNVFDR